MTSYPIVLKANKVNSFAYPEQEMYSVPSNPIENELAVQLSSELGLKFFTNHKVGFYYPDITFIDTGNDIFIDIEIDEPYSQSGFPTHYIDDVNDNRRNKFFVEKGWHVIRFSEYQVKEKRPFVIKSIRLLIQAIREDSFIEFTKYISAFQDNRWSYDEALNSLRDKRREYYNFKTEVIHQKELIIKKEFSSIQDLFNHIITKFFPEFDYREEVIFLPYYISDHYINSKDGYRLIFTDCLPSQGKVQINDKIYRFNHFSDFPRIEARDLIDGIKFDFFTLNKETNVRVFVKKCPYRIQHFFDFFLHGTIKEYSDSSLKLYSYL